MGKQKTYEQINREMWMVVGIAGALVLVAVFMPFVLTKMQAPFGWEIDFTQTGQIGDTIGGITAPFMALMAGVLVFASFRAQIQANRMQWEEIARIRNQDNYKLLSEIVVKNHNSLIIALDALKTDCARIITAGRKDVTFFDTVGKTEHEMEDLAIISTYTIEQKANILTSHFPRIYQLIQPLKESLLNLNSNENLIYLIHSYPYEDCTLLVERIHKTLSLIISCHNNGVRSEDTHKMVSLLKKIEYNLNTFVLTKNPQAEV